MKNASQVLNIVLVIAVAVLFYLHFASSKTSVKLAAPQQQGAAVNSGFRMAYFDMDSINNSFAMVKDVKAELTKEEDRINNELTRLQKTYNDKLMQYQNSQQPMSQVQSEAARRDVMELQNKITAQKQEMDQRYQDLAMRKQQDVKSTVENFLQEYNKAKGYTYIIAYEPGFIFYRDSSYNITADLLQGLNANYSKKK